MTFGYTFSSVCFCLEKSSVFRKRDWLTITKITKVLMICHVLHIPNSRILNWQNLNESNKLLISRVLRFIHSRIDHQGHMPSPNCRGIDSHSLIKKQLAMSLLFLNKFYKKLYLKHVRQALRINWFYINEIDITTWHLS